jgi:hypothetical protein
MSFNVVVVVGCYTKASSVEVEVDQSALDVEQAARKFLLSAQTLITVGLELSVDILEGVGQVKVLTVDRIPIGRWPNFGNGWPREDVHTCELIAFGERQCMGRRFGTISALHLHALGDGVEFPALYGWFSLLVYDESRNARLCSQRLI